ncbi:MAG: hypothetical protein A3F31_04660 [Candidatus Levybacteria bacterium RIFCSPHIGHO2_12_FULL_38_12]|nr:MAG: hypothetical protein A2770_04345 [Candidatus Levybacteria bacterium RIFCSPHIGHO2_01_FULL_38_12]OGH21798.1 MAG: hypothetical protein A3D75_01245 [Candidatus Levybacteria bacterium RIFCSPHIGHO2_02_FULL_37_18]OGH22545.1 MAG: hypothetical protein A3F31_04660 [Candidatus Levybacteria bacterium RIFCSPHIGHO2_12_FULL_38_12]OGH33419.1 MAG: hypothetical protein A3A47_04195 [Candidatus Levybacteria bacterium RIFCSPLOWO2_01_FULL_37_20]OGH44082.1 MAG: hypothetical protein A3J14_05030 [Candidatus Lev
MNIFVKLSILVIIILSLVQIVVSNQLSTTGIILGKLEDQVKTLKDKNFTLREDVLLSSSLTSIASRASSLGYIERKSQIYLTGSVPLALNR